MPFRLERIPKDEFEVRGFLRSENVGRDRPACDSDDLDEEFILLLPRLRSDFPDPDLELSKRRADGRRSEGRLDFATEV